MPVINGKQIDTPELDKLLSVAPQSQVQGSFVAWLTHEREPRVVLAHLDAASEELVWCGTTIEKLLAEYHQINLDRVENERRALIAALASKHVDVTH
jgi:hypothetical protein